MERAETVEGYIRQHPEWQAELLKLRQALLATGLVETLKWGAPCYTSEGKNVVSIGAFKSYVGLWFHQGALLNDPHNVLVNAQEGKTRAMRQWRFANTRDIKPRFIRDYVKECVELMREGKAIKPRRQEELAMPDELDVALADDGDARSAFGRLTPGRQREYAQYIAEAKRTPTKLKRIDKIMPMILAGKGLNDQYRNG